MTPKIIILQQNEEGTKVGLPGDMYMSILTKSQLDGYQFASFKDPMFSTCFQSNDEEAHLQQHLHLETLQPERT